MKHLYKFRLILVSKGTETFADQDQPESQLKIQFVPHSKHSDWLIKTKQLTLFRESADRSEIHTEHTGSDVVRFSGALSE
jgi:hypothetical protein